MSFWEFHAADAGWRAANCPPSTDAPTDEEFEAAKARWGG